MYAELGHFALTLALAVALVQATLPHWGASRGDRSLMALAPSSALLGFALVALSFVCLVAGYLGSDFSITNVWENSHSAKPLIYKISGVWGNHEGSMLLWVSILALFSGLVALFGTNLPKPLMATVLSVQAWTVVTFLLFILLTSNPFARIFPAPFEGNDLNPLLQDPGLAAHPPLLYLGYVGFSISFSFAIAALILGRIDAAWARWVRPWVLTAWIFLTLGIAMGSYWAYYELGWGGWWFWDPVENASLMPWLAGTALLHSAIVMEKREAMKVWTILLSILTFALSLLGTFLVRSGVLTSVHAFASDPARGIFILIIMVGFVGGALALYAWRAPTLRQGGVFAPISREGALVLNNLFLSTMAAAVLVGTLYPLALEALTGEKISVGPPFFNATFGPLAVPLLLLVPFGPLLAWKRGDALAAAQRLMAAAGFAALGGLMAAAIVKDGPWLAPFGVALGLWLIMGALTEVALRVGLFRLPIGTVFSRAAGLPRSAWGTALAHFGIGVVVLGIVGETAWKTEYIGTMAAGDSVDIAKNHVTLTGFETRKGPNYQEQTVHFDVVRPNGTTMKVEAAKRFYPVRRMPTTEAALVERLSGDLYVTLGDPQDDGRIVVRIFYKPLVILIWLGAVVMALGGMLSLSDRRLRVGAPRTARARRPDATLAPAE